MLSVSPSFAEHPLPRLLAASIPCSINADDSLLFGSGILSEYERCRSVLGLDDVQLADIARASLRASAAPGTLIQDSLGAIDDWLAVPGSPAARDAQR
jgi:adenosine deaminase